jgi:pimeloyl-ACP methyl ester carboxylesterase
VLRTWFDDMTRLEAALEQIRPFPALLLWGDRDRAVSLESAQQLERCFDRVQFELLPGAGHVPYEEIPEVFTRLVNSFLAKVREAGPRLVRSRPHLA